jgi:hypothetical protein
VIDQYNHDVLLIYKIVDGLCPNDVIGTPQCYHKLMQKCLDTDSETDLLFEICFSIYFFFKKKICSMLLNFYSTVIR